MEFVSNSHNVKNTRRCRVFRVHDGIATHRNPKNGKMWVDLIDRDGNVIEGGWFNPEDIEFLD